MIDKDIKLIDEVICSIKEKVNSVGYNKFEFYFIISLEIVRYEIATVSKISDKVAEAITQLFAFQSFELYYRDYPDIYSKCSDLAYVLNSYNERLKEHGLGAIGVKDKNWIDFFQNSISALITSNKPNNN